MKPRPFQYADPRSIEEAVGLLAERPDEAKLLAGGQSLVPAMNFGLARPALVVDIGRIAALRYISHDELGLSLGATTRQYEVEDDPVIARDWPGVAQAVRWIGHRAIRHRGTVGGSLAHADPAAEWGAVTVALEAEFTIRSARSERAVLADEFFRAPLTTCLEPDEMLVRLRLPRPPAGARSAFYEVARRHGDFALVGVSAWLAVDGDGRCSWVRLGLCGAGPVPVRARQAERALLGERLSAAAVAEAGRLASLEVEPDGDIHAPAEYRRALTGVCVRRALALAAGERELAGSAAPW